MTILEMIKNDPNVSENFKNVLCSCGGTLQPTINLTTGKIQKICPNCGKLEDIENENRV